MAESAARRVILVAAAPHHPHTPHHFMRSFPWRFVLFTVAAIWARPLAAQEGWTKATVPVAQDLWGICHGNGRFVAVGTAGTILTSDDGSAWSPVPSGTADWLTAVTFGGSQFVAVGDHGTVLTSSNGLVWTRRTSGTLARLNGIAYDDGRYVAVGENGTICRSADGQTWAAMTLPLGTWLRAITPSPQGFLLGDGAGRLFATSDGQSVEYLLRLSFSLEALFWSNGFAGATGSGGIAALSAAPFSSWWDAANVGSTNLRGVTRSGERLIAVGDGGTVVINPSYGYTANGFATTVRLGSANLNAIASSDTATVIVGAAGTIYVATSAAGRGVPALAFRTPLPPTAGLGQSVEFRSIASGRTLTRLQWYHDNVAIPGATGESLVLRGVQTTDSGTYSVRGQDPGGTEPSAAASLTVELMPPTTPLDLRLDAAVIAHATAVAVQPDGKILIAAPMYFLPGGVPQYGLARFTPDGTIDPSFRLTGPGLLPGTSTVTGFAVDTDGAIIVGGYDYFSTTGAMTLPARLNADGSYGDQLRPTPLIVLPDGRKVFVAISANIATVTRQLPNGASDPSYPATVIPLAPEPAPIGAMAPTYGQPIVTGADAAGRYLVSAASYASVGTGFFGSNSSALFRVRADGTRDESFAIAYVASPIEQIVSVGGSYIYRSSWIDGPLGSYSNLAWGRLTSQGLPDETYHGGQLLTSMGLRAAATIGPDGSVYVADRQGVHRYDPAGLEDRTFAAEFKTATNDGPILRSLQRLPDGRFLLRGDFSSISGLPAQSLVVISPKTGVAPSRIANLSIRTTAGSGDETLIVGFVIDGAGSRSILARAVGPGLVPLGLNARDVLPDPRLKLFQRGTVLAENDDWDPALTATAAAVGAQPLPAGSRDSALLTPLARGAYTAHVTSTANAPGIALVELYDAEPATSGTPARLVNVSGRAQVGTGPNVLIAGFVITGESQKNLLIRGIGPGLSAQGVTGVLFDPVLELHRGDSIVARNDDWSSEDAATFAAVGAFALPPNSRDAALVVRLPAGVYSAVVRGAADMTGAAMVEIYDVP
jgi:hypothetical protein